MKILGLYVVGLSFTLFASAQVKQNCSAPAEYPHTRLAKKFATRETFDAGDKVYYKCAEDFTASRGSRSVECVDGKWTNLNLKCEKKTCGSAGALPNGQFRYGGSTLIGERVYAVCNEGYTLKGLNFMTCKRSGWSGEFPSCEVGETTCSPPAVDNSVKSGGNVSGYRVGDSVTFTCSQGFQLDGAQQITCGPDGQWQPQSPRCLPSPDKQTGGCGVPLTNDDSHANLADQYITITSFASRDKVQYVCDVGYVQTGGTKYRTCTDGKWTPLKLKCERKLCGSAGEIQNGEFTYTGVEFGDTATAVCNNGYALVGRATRRCMSNGWDGRVPECEAVECAEPPVVANAEMIGPQEPPYTYRTVVRYQCHVGTLIGQKEIWCTMNGTWSASPQCKETTCPSPNVHNAFWMGARNGGYLYRDTISIECKMGYDMTGPNTITCDSDGKWKPGLPNCKRKLSRAHRRN
uniref:Sushi domain-containing protein n=1 Tax=Monopterus albus TaxID=43700 RepID=A0A3Q3KGG8_MONAL|nr:complement receptor type 1-like [Monopterus albus]